MGVLGSIRDFFTTPSSPPVLELTAPIAAPSEPTVLAAPAPSAPTADLAKPRGTDGVIAYGGWIQSGESNSKLQGHQKWVTYTNAINAAIVATGVRYFGNLLAGTEWHAEPNPAGGAGADRGAEIVRQGLFQAEMTKPWPTVVRKGSMYRLLGFSLHATAVRVRSDGMIVYSSIAHRPQHTIEKWQRLDEQSAWTGVEQRTSSGGTYSIPLHECLYCVDDTLTDSPEGVGLLRHVIQLVNRLDRYQVLEWLAYEGDMAGTPIGRAPLEELRDASGSSDAAVNQAYVDATTATFRGVIENRIKTPELMQYLFLDSKTYQGRDPNTISTVLKWALEIVKSTTNGLPDINEVIKRLQFEIARVLGIEFALVGAEGGSYSMHEDKTSMFATNLQVTLSEMGNFATSQLARRLVALNGLDPDTCTPRCVAEPISTDKIELVTRALENMQKAKLQTNDPARNVIRKRLRLPPEPEYNAALMPLGPVKPGAPVDDPAKKAKDEKPPVKSPAKKEAA